VVTVREAAELRQASITAPLLVLGGVHDADEAAAALSLAVTPVVHHPGHVALLAEAAGSRGRALGVQVEVDTGMRRMGVAPDQAVALLEAVAGEPTLSLEGVYTHLARGDEPELEPSLEQIAVFRSVLEGARRRAVATGLVHVAHSGGLLAGEVLADALPEARAVRPGLLLYGVPPAAHLAADLRPAMTLRTRIAHVRRVGAGETVGYSAVFRAQRATRVATLPIGYADGVPVSTSNRGTVLIRGRRMPIAGRVSMDFVGVDVGDEPVEIGEEAILFGEGQGTRLISYELLVRVGSRVPRVYTD
jgi:alanine racemase